MNALRVARALLFASVSVVCGSAWAAPEVTEYNNGISAGVHFSAIAPTGSVW